MPKRSADATWKGDLPNGNGVMKLKSGAYEGAYSFRSRFEDGAGSNPEELIAAAHAGCFSMALSNVLAEAGYDPESVETTADVTLRVEEDGPSITNIHLTTEATVPDIDDDAFQEQAEAAVAGCPVSKALSATDITLDASLT